MKHRFIPLLPTAALAVGIAVAVAVASPAVAGSVENMERERAILIETLLKDEITPEERHAKATVAKRRLVDLERIVLRDKSLVGHDTPAVKRAFANYDLSFLVHAAAESRTLILDHWLDQVGMSTQDIMAAAQRRR